MPDLAKILLPVDLSERSAGAARYARALALHFNSDVILAHALPPLYSDLGGMEFTGAMLVDVYRSREEAARREIEAFVAAELGGVNVRCVILHGEAAGSIVNLAHDEQVDLVTLPTHGYGPFRRFILGSNTAKVLHDCNCAILTGVHLETGPAGAPVPFRRVLCAIDLGPHSAATLAWAVWLQREFGATLTVIHAMTAHPEPAGEPESNWRSGLREAAEEEILMLQRDSGVEAEILLEAGDAGKVICSAAGRLAADVLVIGRGSSGGALGRLRANSYAIIRQSPCPVISV
jgi:nucleotide-binding universal stress UspA family protein